MDAYYRSNPSLIVAADQDAITTKRPLKYTQHEDEEIQKNMKGVHEKDLPGDAIMETREM